MSHGRSLGAKGRGLSCVGNRWVLWRGDRGRAWGAAVPRASTRKSGATTGVGPAGGDSADVESAEHVSEQPDDQLGDPLAPGHPAQS